MTTARWIQAFAVILTAVVAARGAAQTCNIMSDPWQDANECSTCTNHAGPPQQHSFVQN